MAAVRVGTSGWHYESWRGRFFPAGLPIKGQLRYYAGQFDTTELNGVFYRTPTPAAVSAWRAETGEHFVFAWKASKFITHWKRLSDNKGPLPPIMTSLTSLSGIQMTKRRSQPLASRKAPRPTRAGEGSAWQLQAAKARFSEVFRRARAVGPQVVTRGGVDAVVVLPIEQYEMLIARSNQPKSLVDFFRQSPLAGLDLHLERDPDTGRQIAL